MYYLLRTVPRRSFSVLTAPLSTQSTLSSDNDILASILEDHSHTQLRPPPQLTRSKFANNGTPRWSWKPIQRESHVTPYELTYNARSRTPPPFIKKATVSPGSGIARYNDVFYQLDLDPLEECQNSYLLTGFVSDMGKIFGREKTGLTAKSQRRLGKAIRRAKQMGVMPVLSKIKSEWQGGQKASRPIV